MELKREEYKISRCVCRGSAQAYSSGDIIVPDTKPDVIKVIQVDAASAIEDKQIRDNKITIAGKVNLKILYVPDKEDCKVCSINTSFDFSEDITCKNAAAGMYLTAMSNVSNADFSVVNSRKLRVRVSVTLDYDVTDMSGEYIACGAEDETAELMTDNIVINNIREICEHKFILQEKFELPIGQPPVSELLKCETQITDTEYKAINGRIIIKGMLVICALYLSEDGVPENAEIETPFTEVIDSENVTDNSECDIEYDIINVFCDTAEDSDGDIRVINAEAEARAQIKVMEKTEIGIIKDCYVPGMKTELQRETLSIEEIVASLSAQNTIKETVEISSGAPSVKSIYNIVMKPHLTKVETADGKVLCEGKTEAYILYLSDSGDSPVYSLKKEIPFAYTLEDDAVEAGLTAQMSAEIKHSGYTLNAAGEVELRCILALGARVTKKRDEQIVTEAEAIEEDGGERCGIVIYYIQNGDSLWDIAKHYAVARDKIAKYNELAENEALKQGEKLFIPN
ncbi:MAG: DUF3794 domain-containing protein [Firmicutes bacterium]|nr:DUF3794 domain-containing protein [Bacillota bacterium]